MLCAMLVYDFFGMYSLDCFVDKVTLVMSLKVNNDICDMDLPDMLACCLDGGDCACMDELSRDKCCPDHGPSVLSGHCFFLNNVCPTCPFDTVPFVGDGVCHPELHFSSFECCFDAGDCFVDESEWFHYNWSV